MFTIADDVALRGAPEVKGESLAKWLKFMGVADKYCALAPLYVSLGEKYGVRGDIALVQSVLETGWFWKNSGHFDVDPAQNNFAGLGATGGGVKGDVFSTPAIGIEAQIQDLSLRCNGAIPIDKVLSAYARKVYSTITGYHHTRWAQLAGTWAADLTYWTQILKLMSQYNSWAKTQPVSPVTPVTVDPMPAVGYSLSARSTRAISILKSLRDYAPFDFFEIPSNVTADPVRTQPPAMDPPPTTSTPPTHMSLGAFKVWLDVGHGITGEQTYDSGAIGPAGEHEHKLNILQAESAMKYLESKGCKVTLGLYTRKGEGVGLEERAKRAKAYDCFVSIHLNAYDKKAEYSVAFVRKDATKLDYALGNFIAGETSKVKGEKNLGAANWSNYSVLMGAATVGVPACISEACFLDSPGEKWPEDAPKFGTAIGVGIEKFLLSL